MDHSTKHEMHFGESINIGSGPLQGIKIYSIQTVLSKYISGCHDAVFKNYDESWKTSFFMEGKLSQPGSFTFQLENKWKTKLSCMYGGDKLRWGKQLLSFPAENPSFISTPTSFVLFFHPTSAPSPALSPTHVLCAIYTIVNLCIAKKWNSWNKLLPQ